MIRKSAFPVIEPPAAGLSNPRSTSRDLPLFTIFVLGAFAIRLVFVYIADNNAVDAWSRYQYALNWSQHPSALPNATLTDAWLPLHFWLLGIVLWLRTSEVTARIFTALLGALMVGFYWSILARAFDRRIAVASSLLLALFGFHIAYSVSTTSEVPTIFFLAAGLYGWLRFTCDEKWLWAGFSIVMVWAASLCRFEAWLCAPVLALMLLDVPNSLRAILSNRRQVSRALVFGMLASAAGIGWLIFSYYKWGDAFELPHRTMWLNLHFRAAILRHSLGYRLLTVPVALLTSISPLVAGLAALGLYRTLFDGTRSARAIAMLALVLFTFNYWNAIRYEVTQARYTLLYSWLLIPFSFVGLRYLSALWHLRSRAAFALTVSFFLLWQTGIVIAATYAPARIADRVAQMSPTLPLQRELRELTRWLLKHRPSGAVILDDFNWNSGTVARVAHLDTPNTFRIRARHYNDNAVLVDELNDFVRTHHPELLVCSPYGPIGRLWSVDDRKSLDVENLGIELQQQWSSSQWRVYTIAFNSRISRSTGQ